MMSTSTLWNAKCTFLATIKCWNSVTEGKIMTIFHFWRPTFILWCVCVCVCVCESSIPILQCSIIISFCGQACEHMQGIWLLCPTMNLHTNRHTAVVHHRLNDFADIELQVIVNEPCDVRLSICPPYSSIEIVSKWRQCDSHWKLFTGIMHVTVVITFISLKTYAYYITC